ncbi:MAG: alpha/beta fold hydrolase [Candidatus Magasanikbacteria bacterium]
MSAKKHIVIFSHGFGARKDDRGLFSDIAIALPGAHAIMFDYNEVDEQNNTITVKPFSEQAMTLKKIIEEQKQNNPDAEIDLIGHSQGCRIIAIVHPANIRKIILIAPPTDIGIDRTLARYKKQPGAIIDLNGITKLPRTDGSFSLIPAKYWQEREGDTPPINSYNKLAQSSEITIIKPTQDTVSGEQSFNGLSNKITMIELDGNHDFTHSRKELCETIKNIIL